MDITTKTTTENKIISSSDDDYADDYEKIKQLPLPIVNHKLKYISHTLSKILSNVLTIRANKLIEQEDDDSDDSPILEFLDELNDFVSVLNKNTMPPINIPLKITKGDDLLTAIYMLPHFMDISLIHFNMYILGPFIRFITRHSNSEFLTIFIDHVHNNSKQVDNLYNDSSLRLFYAYFSTNNIGNIIINIPGGIAASAATDPYKASSLSITSIFLYRYFLETYGMDDFKVLINVNPTPLRAAGGLFKNPKIKDHILDKPQHHWSFLEYFNLSIQMYISTGVRLFKNETSSNIWKHALMADVYPDHLRDHDTFLFHLFTKIIHNEVLAFELATIWLLESSDEQPQNTRIVIKNDYMQNIHTMLSSSEPIVVSSKSENHFVDLSTITTTTTTTSISPTTPTTFSSPTSLTAWPEDLDVWLDKNSPTTTTTIQHQQPINKSVIVNKKIVQQQPTVIIDSYTKEEKEILAELDDALKIDKLVIEHLEKPMNITDDLKQLKVHIDAREFLFAEARLKSICDRTRTCLKTTTTTKLDFTLEDLKAIQTLLNNIKDDKQIMSVYKKQIEDIIVLFGNRGANGGIITSTMPPSTTMKKY